MKFVTYKEVKRRIKKGIGVSLVAFGSAIIGGMITVNKLSKTETIILLIFIFLFLTVGTLLLED